MKSKSIGHSLIMAAGRGLRMMPLTEKIPKPLLDVNGTTLISSGINFLKSKMQNIHITVGYKGNVVAEHVISKGVNSIFNTDGKGNAWWIFNTLLKYLNEPILVLTCDNIVELDLEILTEEYYQLGAPPCLVVPVSVVDGLEGDFISQSNHIVTELSRTKHSEVYCSGIQIINPFFVNKLVTPSDNFNTVWSELIVKEMLFCSDIYPSRWTAIDTVEQLNNFSKKTSK